MAESRSSQVEVEPVLRRIDESLWDANRDIQVRRVLTMPRRMTVIRSSDGLTLHSPVPHDEGLEAAVRELGTVRHIVAPCLPHDRFLAPWMSAFPASRLLAVRGFEPEGAPLPRAPETLEGAALPADLVPFRIAGMPKHRETALHHPPTRTLIVADLVFNIREAGDLVSRMIHRLNGCWKRATGSRYFRSLIDDREAFERSLESLLELEVDRLVPGHGEIVEEGATAVLRTAFGRPHPASDSGSAEDDSPRSA